VDGHRKPTTWTTRATFGGAGGMVGKVDQLRVVNVDDLPEGQVAWNKFKREHGRGRTSKERFDSALIAWSKSQDPGSGRDVLLDAFCKEFPGVSEVNDKTIRIIGPGRGGRKPRA
jgi:hypothetical protein